MNSISDRIARRKVWTQASQFNEASDFLWDKGVSDFMLPIIVNYAFASELALKSCDCCTRANAEALPGLISTASFTSKIRVRNHNLVDLFAKLHMPLQTHIQAQFRQEMETELTPLLEDCQSCFVDGRYAYENHPTSFPLTNLRTLSNGLVNATQDLD